jgi:DNA-binding MarR family transcriptional regulator
MQKRYEDVLVALRTIMRASDVYSRRLSRTAGLTTPQLLVLRAVAQHGDVPISAIANELQLAQATVTTIVDRLEQRLLVYRVRSQADRRVVHLRLTDDGKDALSDAPEIVQAEFAERFRELPDWEQSMITASIQRVAELMNTTEDVNEPDEDGGESRSALEALGARITGQLEAGGRTA